MKIILSAVLALSLSLKLSAQTVQTCTIENFNGTTAGWTYSQGAHVGNYDNPTMNCAPDRGIITPGVGGNNPCNIQTPSFRSTGAYLINLSFDIIVLNANLKCNTWKDYACQTSVDVFYYIGNTRYTAITDFVLPPNGPGNPTNVSMSFDPGNNLPAGTVYNIEMCFKPKSGVGNCIQQNTKYVFDNFRNCETASRPVNERQVNSQEKSNINSYSVYPNPTNGAARITANGDEGVKSIKLMNEAGIPLRSALGINFMIFDIKDLPAGKYVMQFEKKTGELVKKNIEIN